ncbi:MAG TPA: glycosyltransferase family 4 protein [Candidatus Limnocylindria bacterium]|nr:glycosyltransferase family 4 protein [Candidatus Limnocylindria bacterium]
MPYGRLTILQLTHQGDGAGSTQSILDLSRELARRGNRVILGCRAESLLARLAPGTGVEIVPLVFDRTHTLAETLANVITREGVQVVNSHATRDRRTLTWLRWRNRLPQAFVVTRRTMPLTSPLELWAVGHTADATIAVSHAVARALRQRLQPAERMVVVPNGIRLERLPEPSESMLHETRKALDAGDRPVIAVLSRRKDHDVLLEAMRSAKHPACLVLVGLEPDERLQTLAEAVPKRHRVVFVPFTSDPIRFYRIAHIAALPSRIEGLSQALLEAMALGLPVVASNAGGNPDLIEHERTGLLVPPRLPHAWAQALDRLLEDHALRARLAEAGRSLVRREFTIARTTERTEDVYRQALARRGQPRPEFAFTAGREGPRLKA